MMAAPRVSSQWQAWDLGGSAPHPRTTRLMDSHLKTSQSTDFPNSPNTFSFTSLLFFSASMIATYSPFETPHHAESHRAAGLIWLLTQAEKSLGAGALAKTITAPSQLWVLTLVLEKYLLSHLWLGMSETPSWVPSETNTLYKIQVCSRDFSQKSAL